MQAEKQEAPRPLRAQQNVITMDVGMPPRKTYRDLRRFGLEFVTPETEQFSKFLQEIQDRPQSIDADASAAVLLNQSGKVILALAYCWKYTTVDGNVRTSHYSNLCSSTQIDVLTGQADVGAYRLFFILPGSKRLITENGIFGDNSDVLPPDSPARAVGRQGYGGSGFRRGPGQGDIAEIELSLDLVFLEDGLCVGPDEFGLFDSVFQDLQRQRTVAQQILEMLGRGESIGQVFEVLWPFAQRTRTVDTHPSGMLSMFANMAIDHLINMGQADLLTWFERSAQASRIELHRPA